MRSIVVFLPLALAGCPPPTHYLIADVTAARAPVADAMVAADCGRRDGRHDAAMRTDSDGRARLVVYRTDAGRCTVTIAKPGHRTIEVAGINLCNTTACPSLEIDLLPSHAPYTPRDPYVPMNPYTPYDEEPIAPPVPRRTYATPPGVL